MTEEEEREAKRAYMRDYMRARRAKERANSGVESPTPKTPRTPRYTQAASISQDTETTVKPKQGLLGTCIHIGIMLFIVLVLKPGFTEVTP